MRIRGLYFAALAVLVLAALPTQAATPLYTQCPAIGANTGCAVLVTFNANGTTTITLDPAQGPYDSSDDTLFGVVNNSGKTQTSLTLSGVGSTGAPIFGFESDGICTFTFTGNGYCSSLPAGATGYEGPKTTYVNISADQKTGTILFTGGLPAGATTYFSLEDAITTATVPVVVGGGGGPTTPAPSSLILLLTGIGIVALYQGRRQLAQLFS